MVIALIAILAALLLPALSRARSRAHGCRCLNKTRQLVLARHRYSADRNGRLAYNLGGDATRKTVVKETNPYWVKRFLTWELDADNTNTATLTVDDGLDGRLFYAELATGLIQEFRLSQFAAGILPYGLTVHGFGEDAAGELYALVTNTAADGAGGIVYKLFPAVRLTVQVSGAILDIAWPITGGRLESQINSLSSANWVTVPGSSSTNRVAVPLDAANSSVFYRLALP